jgi:hypothetical protein
MMKTSLQMAIMLVSFNAAPPAIAMPLGDAAMAISSPLVEVKDRRFGSPPIDPNLPSVTGDSINAEVNAELAARFAEAVGASSGLLTKQQAKNASWGYIADHFAAIDRDHDGYVKLGDVLDFIQSGSAGAPAGPKGVQIVE